MQKVSKRKISIRVIREKWLFQNTAIEITENEFNDVVNNGKEICCCRFFGRIGACLA